MSDLGNPRDVARRNRESNRAAIARKEMLIAIMDLKQGRAFMADLLAECHIYNTSFSSDPLRMAFAEGERNIGLRLTADLTAATPEQFALMLKEIGEKDVIERSTDNASRQPAPGEYGPGGDDASGNGGERDFE